MDIEDKIRINKHKGQKEFVWDDIEWKKLEDFLSRHGFEFVNGSQFMGVKHFKKSNAK